VESQEAGIDLLVSFPTMECKKTSTCGSPADCETSFSKVLLLGLGLADCAQVFSLRLSLVGKSIDSGKERVEQVERLLPSIPGAAPAMF
jgi:hypothetical protein